MKSYIRWLLVLFFLLTISIATAAEVVQQDQYILPEGEVFEGDLYVFAGDSVVIDGVVQGDLIAAATNIRVNGRVDGDVLGVGFGSQIDGEVVDDVRLLTVSSEINGQIGGDVATTGSGGGSFTATPLPVGDRIYDQGVFIGQDAKIDGDLLVSAGLLRVSGLINGRLFGTTTNLDLDAATIEKGADVTIASDIRVDEDSFVGGSGFSYESPIPLNVSSTLSENITYTEIANNTGTDWLTVFRQIAGRLVVFAVLGWFLLRYFPTPVIRAVTALNVQFTQNVWTSVLVLLGLPFITLALTIIFAFFLSAGPMLAVMGFVAFSYAVLWSFSPLVVGLWVGQWFSNQAYNGFILGVSIIVVASQLPGLGFMVSSMSATIALAALIGLPAITLPDVTPDSE